MILQGDALEELRKLPDKFLTVRLIVYMESERCRKEQVMEAINRGALRVGSEIDAQPTLETSGEVLG